MANRTRKEKNVRKKSNKLNYFFLEGELDGKDTYLIHKSLHINHAQDTIISWCYPLDKRVVSTYSLVRKKMEPAFTTREVMAMVRRTRPIIEEAILGGNIETPQHTYGLTEVRRKHAYMWHEKNIMELHAYLSTIHRGRPRNDGLITTHNLPNARELRAIINQRPIMGFLDEQGNFTPTWLAKEI